MLSMNKKPTPQQNYLEIGKIPPQAVDIEEAILGALILEPGSITDIEHYFKPEVFYKKENVLVAEVIQSMHREGHKIDLLTVVNELMRLSKLDEAGGPYYLSQLTQKIASAANIEEHYRIIYEKYIAREMIVAGSKILQKSYDADLDVFELLDENITTLENVRQGVASTGEQDMYSILTEHTEDLKKLCKLAETGEHSGIQTPLSKLTKATRGWQPSDLIIIAGRPGMGKTAFMLECIFRACEAGYSVLCFSLEMSGRQLVKRLLQGMGMTEAQLKDGQMTESSWIEYQKHLSFISGWKLHIDDTGGVDVNYVKAVSNRIKKKNGLDFILIDYLQYMDLGSSKNATTDEKIGNITRTLKAMAKNMDIPIMLLSQLNREVEKRPNKRPQLSDLRASGNIEQDADIALFLYRPAYYGIKENETGDSTDGYLEVINAKNRHGETGVIYQAEHNESITRILDYGVSNFTNSIDAQRPGPNANFYEVENTDDVPY